MNSHQPGSQWRKWDLHVHTPDSLVNEYGGDWDRFLAEIESLPPEFKVIGVMITYFWTVIRHIGTKLHLVKT